MLQALDIKRALLTFDQVNLCAPDDRELINPVSFMTALTPIPLPISFGSPGPVLPLGKVDEYDQFFAQTLEECEPAVRQGSLVIRASPKLVDGGMILGSVPMPRLGATSVGHADLPRTGISTRPIACCMSGHAA
jgi:hypothetical protein